MAYFRRLRSLCAVVDISDRLCSCRGKLTNKPEVLVSSYCGYVPWLPSQTISAGSITLSVTCYFEGVAVV